MSYLPQPLNPVHQPIQVPCEAVEDYDGGPLAAYPERKGWHNKTILEWISLFMAPPKEFRAFLETWLLFGIVQQGFVFRHREPVKISDICTILQGPNQTRLLDAAKLKALMENWLINEGINGSPITWDEEYYIVVRTVQYMQTTRKLDRNEISELPETFLSSRCSLTQFTSSCPPSYNPLSPEINLLVSLLHEFFSATASLQRPVRLERLRTAHSYSAKKLRRWNSLITLRMREDGWCPYQISVLHEKFNAPALCFVSDFERPSPDVTHHCVRIRRSHTNADYIEESPPQQDSQDICTHLRCAQTMLRPQEYRTKHVSGCLGCHDMVASRAELHDILLQRNTFPLVFCINEGDDSDAVRFVEYSSDIAYVAISHVWSDGLGNLERNAIPRCQMLRLSSLVQELPGKASNCVLFWLDTLCIPPDTSADDKEAQDAQSVAIGFMRQTYENACAVLVLESWLLKHQTQGCSTAEVLLRILSSSWNTRLWTLQEGALAREILFQFADAAFDAEDGIRRLINENDAILDYTLKSSIVQGFQDIRSLVWDNRTSSSITGLMRTLRARSTSVASDEAICIAALLNVDIHKVLAVDASDSQERMRVLWSLVPHVPSSVIFYLVRTLSAPGYRWAPQSLLRPSPHEAISVADVQIPRHHHLKTGKLTATGLEVRYPGLCIMFFGHSLTHQPIGNPIYLRDYSDRYYEIMNLRLTPDSARSRKALLESYHQDFQPFISSGKLGLHVDYLALLQAFAAPWHPSDPFARVTDPLFAHYRAFIITEIPVGEIRKGVSCAAIFTVQAEKRKDTDPEISCINVRRVHHMYLRYLGNEKDAMSTFRAIRGVDKENGYCDDSGFRYSTGSGNLGLYPVFWAPVVDDKKVVWRVD
jgi:hypothetical protein